MSGINGIGNSQSVQRIINQPVMREVSCCDETAGGTRSDRLEVSGMGHLLKMLKSDGDVRTDKVADIKARIEAGTYGEDEKLDFAIERLLDELNG